MISIPRGKIYFSFRALKRIFLSVFKKDISGDKYIRQFERELSDYLGVEHVILTSSGTLSLYLSLKALKIPEDSEVIVSAYTVPEVVSVIILVGAKPVFVDIDPDTYNMNVSLLEGCITSETKVIILTHMYGQPCDIDPVLDLAKRYKLKVIEDVAQALGSEYRERKVGTFGFLSYYSFGIMKNINTLGGGAIATNDTNLADSIRNIISGFGAPDAGELFIKLFKVFFLSIFTNPLMFTFFVYPAVVLIAGIDSKFLRKFLKGKKDLEIKQGDLPQRFKIRFSNIQALIGIEQLRKLDYNNQLRIINANEMSRLLKNTSFKIPKSLSYVKNIYINYVIQVDNKDKIILDLLLRGIDTTDGYIQDCSSLPKFKSFKKYCPVSRKLAENNLYIPIHPPLKQKHVVYIARVLKDICD